MERPGQAIADLLAIDGRNSPVPQGVQSGNLGKPKRRWRPSDHGGYPEGNI